MRERPILFSAPMVRAILEGRKTVTRRAVKGMALEWLIADRFTPEYVAMPENGMCHYGQPGDRLWVRETWAETDRHDGIPVVSYASGGCVAVGRDGANGLDMLLPTINWADTPEPHRWRPSIHMPRWASRITLEVTGVRVERLQGISEAGALAEGIDGELCRQSISKSPLKMGYLPVCAFAYLWDQINGAGNWDANPLVWVIEFQRVPQPIAAGGES